MRGHRVVRVIGVEGVRTVLPQQCRIETSGAKFFPQRVFRQIAHGRVGNYSERRGRPAEVGLRAEHGGMRPPASTDCGTEIVRQRDEAGFATAGAEAEDRRDARAHSSQR